MQISSKLSINTYKGVAVPPSQKLEENILKNML